ncbi:hypothetical protein DIPPA_16215 [Diplonema papillatum]|nr:hypothetical protein DIPPA_16215 [Diplonema papillatum]
MEDGAPSGGSESVSGGTKFMASNVKNLMHSLLPFAMRHSTLSLPPFRVTSSARITRILEVLSSVINSPRICRAAPQSPVVRMASKIALNSLTPSGSACCGSGDSFPRTAIILPTIFSGPSRTHPAALFSASTDAMMFWGAL